MIFLCFHCFSNCDNWHLYSYIKIVLENEWLMKIPCNQLLKFSWIKLIIYWFLLKQWIHILWHSMAVSEVFFITVQCKGLYFRNAYIYVDNPLGRRCGLPGCADHILATAVMLGVLSKEITEIQWYNRRNSIYIAWTPFNFRKTLRKNEIQKYSGTSVNERRS